MECEYCKNVFCNKTTLNNHQKTAKYCVKLRGETIQEQHICEACDKTFTRKFELERHRKLCRKIERLYILENEVEKLNNINTIYKEKIEEKEQQIKLKDIQIQELQDKLENVATTAVSRPSNTKNTQINNYIQNLQPITDTTFTDNLDNLTIDHITKGPEGYAEYALEFPLKDKLLCVDYSRRKVKFKDKDGNVITDPEMTKLAINFFAAIKDKNTELIIEYGNQLKENFVDEVDTIAKIFDYKAAVNICSDGEKPDFFHDFVKQVCNKTVKE